LEVNGGGLALADFDGDGDQDLVVVDGSTMERVAAGEPGLPPRFLANDGAGTFELPSGDGKDAWNLAPGRWGMGAAAGDVDGDGHVDLLVTEWGPDRLFRNAGGAGFVEVEQSGLTGERWGASAAFFDADNDGFLDLVVVNYLAFAPDRIQSRTSGACRWKGHAVMCGPEGLNPVHDQFYANRGDGTFEDVSVARGFRPRAAGFGLGVLPLDLDVDGDTDVYVTNDSTPNHLWENDGAGSFREIGFLRGVALDPDGKEQAGMGVAAGDVNLDGRPDLVVTNFSGEPNALYLSRGRGWSDRGAPAGIAGPSLTMLGWGAALEDFDQDGLLDLAVLNGHVYPQADEPGTDTSYVDGDGDLDLVALAVDGPVRVLENRAATGGSLTVRLVGRGANTAGLGARVRIVLGEGDAARELRREVGTSAGFQAAKPALAHFGLGDAKTVTSVEVTWPSGAVSTRTDVAPGVLVIEEPAPDATGEDRR
jgi:hypothetical protein